MTLSPRLALLLGLLAITPPGIASDSNNSATHNAAHDATPIIATRPGDTMEFELRDTDGQLHRLSDYRGQWVIINFQATWCGPCIREIPVFNDFYQKHRARGAAVTHETRKVSVTVLGINYEELDAAALKVFIQRHGIQYPVLLIGDQPLIPMEPLKGLPSTFLVSPQGELLDSWLGELEADTLESWLPETDSESEHTP